jgi:hypothetical protein
MGIRHKLEPALLSRNWYFILFILLIKAGSGKSMLMFDRVLFLLTLKVNCCRPSPEPSRTPEYCSYLYLFRLQISSEPDAAPSATEPVETNRFAPRHRSS